MQTRLIQVVFARPIWAALQDKGGAPEGRVSYRVFVTKRVRKFTATGVRGVREKITKYPPSALTLEERG